jgi:uncharacterized membrane protein YdjX (TVP38/TMEM64 family)
VKAKAGKVVFGLLWVGLFYELVFNPALREPLLAFCKAHPQLAPGVLILTQLVLASFALPCSPLSVLAGILWGLYLGIVYSTLATVASSVWTFFLGRRFLRERMKGREPAGWWLAISRLIERYKWKAAMLAHANPVFPGSSLGYVFGASRLEFGSFLLGAILGTLPLQLLTVALGSAAGKGLSGFSVKTGVVVGLLVAALIAYKFVAPKLLNRFNGNGGRQA